MSYKCGFCGRSVTGGQKMLKHVTYRKVLCERKVTEKRSDTTFKAERAIQSLHGGGYRTEVERETPSCGSCLAAIREGVGVGELGHGQTDGQVNEVGEVMLGVLVHNPSICPPTPPPDWVGIPLCDVCGEEVIDGGQVTPESTLCARHLKNRKGFMKRKGEK